MTTALAKVQTGDTTLTLASPTRAYTAPEQESRMSDDKKRRVVINVAWTAIFVNLAGLLWQGYHASRKTGHDAITLEMAREAQAKDDRLKNLQSQFDKLQREQDAFRAIRESTHLYKTGVKTGSFLDVRVFDDHEHGMRSAWVEFRNAAGPATIPVASPDKHKIFALLKDVTGITKLTVSGLILDGSDLRFFSGIETLTYLDLRFTGVTDDALRELNCPKSLVELRLIDNPRLTLAGLKPQENVRVLTLRGPGFNANTVRQVPQAFPLLTAVSCPDIACDADGLAALFSLQDIQSVTVNAKGITEPSDWLAAAKLAPTGHSVTVTAVGLVDADEVRTAVAAVGPAIKIVARNK